MGDEEQHAGAGVSLGDRLATLRHQRFVGRTAEREVFASLLKAPDLTRQVIFVHGPGGIGKSALLVEFSRISREEGVPALYLDARNFDTTPQGLQEALRLDSQEPPGTVGGFFARMSGRRSVFLLDTYEQLTLLDGWLREAFLPGLPAETIVVLAGRQPPSLAWRMDPGWQDLLLAMPLRNLSPGEASDYLLRRSVPAPQRQRVLAFTHGHPLALSLAADAVHQQPDRPFRPEAAPGMLKGLLDHFLDHVPGPAHRAALEGCAVVRVTNETLLRHLLVMPDVQSLFDWLRGLSFVESGHNGLFPHDLAREALIADLHWRNREWHLELLRRAQDYYADRLKQAIGPDGEEVLADFIFLHRDNRVLRPYVAPTGEQAVGLTWDVLRDRDVPQLLAMVTAHEGDESARLAAQWFQRQAQGVTVVRGEEGEPAAFCAMVSLHQLRPEEIQGDPAVAGVWAYLERHAPLGPGEGVTLLRHWMARATYQDISPAQNLLLVHTVKRFLMTPNLRFSFITCANPQLWAAIAAYTDLQRLPEADFRVGGRTYSVYGRDWRTVPPIVWLTAITEREFASAGQATSPPRAVEPVHALSRSEFASAVKGALKSFTRPALLASSPLLSSRLVLDGSGTGGDAQRVSVLQALLREAAQELEVAPRTEKLYQALYHTYLHPAPTQERAAEILDLPFSTFRRHLTAAVEYVIEAMWQREDRYSRK